MIVAEVVRALGPLLLRNILGGNNGGNNGGGMINGMRDSPLFDDDDDDDDEEDQDDRDSSNSRDSFGRSRVSVALPTFPTDEADTTQNPNASPTITTTTIATTMTPVTSQAGVDEATTMTTRTMTTTIPPAVDNEVTTTLWPLVVNSSVKLSSKVMILRSTHSLARSPRTQDCRGHGVRVYIVCANRSWGARESQDVVELIRRARGHRTIERLDERQNRATRTAAAVCARFFSFFIEHC